MPFRFTHPALSAGLAALLLLAFGAPADAQKRGLDRQAAADGADDLNRQPDPQGDGEAAPCPSDRFFVHVPTWAAVTVPANFQNRLETELSNRAAARPALGGARVVVEPVLDSRPGIAERADGHRRFWTITTGMDIPASELCGWIDFLRTQAEVMAGGDIYVGRECVAGGLTSAGAPDWPLTVMGIPAAPAGVPAPIVVIDSGFKRRPDWIAPSVAPRSPKHPHGRMVRAAIQQLTAHIGVPRLIDYRVLGADGSAPLADVARAIDAAVFNVDGPRVINLSIGWPPELERRRAVPGCGILEDPAGEAVRYALAMAHLSDAGQLTAGPGQLDPNAPTAVLIAAGNRPTLFGQDVTPYYSAHHRVDFTPLAGDCSQPSGDGLFYPAQWARRQTCLPVGGGLNINRMRVTPVGGTDHRDERSPLSAPEMTPVLVAPGVAIRLNGKRWSGSSIATAYASAAVSLEMAGGGGGGAAAVLAVYSRGAHLPHLGGLLAVRRLSFPGAHAPAAPTWIGGGPNVDGSGATSVAGRDRLACLATLAGWFQGTRTPAQVAAACPPFLTALDRFSAGDAGPQPPTTGCPECFAHLRIATEDADVEVTLTDEWDPSTTTLSDPYLVVSWPDGYESWIELPYDPAQWQPTGQFVIKGIPLTDRKAATVSDLIAKGSLSLVMTVEQYGKTTIDVSLVTIK